MRAISTSDEHRATWKVSQYPSTTLQPLGPSSNPLPSNFTVVFVESYNTQRYSRVVHPEAFAPGQALDQIETTTSGNQHLRVYTNQPWAVMDKEVCSVVDTFNRSCLHIGSDFRSDQKSAGQCRERGGRWAEIYCCHPSTSR